MSPEHQREAASILRSLAVWEDDEAERKRMCFLADLLESDARKAEKGDACSPKST
jgi:hypothetical protein